METSDYILQFIAGFMVSFPIIVLIISRIGRLEMLNRKSQTHFDIWKNMQKDIKENK